MLILCLVCIILSLPSHTHAYMTAIINFEYYTPNSNYVNRSEDTRTNGVVSNRGSQSAVRNRPAFLLMDANGGFDACQAPINARYYSNGIAIIQRGGNCTFSVKITRAAQYGASGENELISMKTDGRFL